MFNFNFNIYFDFNDNIFIFLNGILMDVQFPYQVIISF